MFKISKKRGPKVSILDHGSGLYEAIRTAFAHTRAAPAEYGEMIKIWFERDVLNRIWAVRPHRG